VRSVRRDLRLCPASHEHQRPQYGDVRVRAALADFDIEVIGSGRRWPLDSPAFDVMTQTWSANGWFLCGSRLCGRPFA
jgi:hypothetical protein